MRLLASVPQNSRCSRGVFALCCGVRGLLLLLCGAPLTAAERDTPTPLTIGDSFVLQSVALAEPRRINVYLPPGYAAGSTALPVLYMLDGGIAEDFLHIAGLVQVSVGNGTMRPFILVGIENTERRRDLTGPTEDPEDRKIAPRVGGSAAFRRFLRTELKSEIQKRYRVTAESALVGESLAGLFVIETLSVEPELFDTYIAFDPSLWWNRERLLRSAVESVVRPALAGRSLFIGTSSQAELGDAGRRFCAALAAPPIPRFQLRCESFPEETHATLFHPAALAAFRQLFAPPPAR